MHKLTRLIRTICILSVHIFVIFSSDLSLRKMIVLRTAYRNQIKFFPCTGSPYGPPGVISSRDVQPTVPVPTYPAYPTQVPPGQMQPIIYDSGLIQAVTNAQTFIAQTFPGAKLLENHNVSLWVNNVST